MSANNPSVLDDSSDEDYDEELEEEAALAAAVVIFGAEMGRQRRIEARFPHRRYLRRPQLLPDPRENTPWQVLYNTRDDRAFITTMGLDCAMFDLILQSGFAERWNQSTIPREDTNPHGQPRLCRRSLDAAGALGLIYHYLTSAMPDTALQQIFALIPSTVARYRSFALVIFWHDAKIARPIYSKLRDRTPPGYFLIADTAFPRGAASIAGRIQAPLKSNQQLPRDPQERDALLARNRQLVSYRQTAEWGMRYFRASWGRLRLPLDISDSDGRANTLE
ncbi:hypothetical protein BV20DRAFT_981169, partial [Pilatotrama ljubarskyi]